MDCKLIPEQTELTKTPRFQNGMFGNQSITLHEAFERNSVQQKGRVNQNQRKAKHKKRIWMSYFGRVLTYWMAISPPPVWRNGQDYGPEVIHLYSLQGLNIPLTKTVI